VSERSPQLGYVLAAVAAAMFAVSGIMARKLLDSGVSPWHLTELRSVITFVLLLVYLRVKDPALLRIRRDEVKRLAFLGIFGFAAVQSTYFAAISRLDIGVALTIQFTAPLLILVFVQRDHPRRVWWAAGMSVVGTFFMVKAYDAHGLDGLGLLAAAASCLTYAIYLLAAENAGERHDARTTLVWAFGFCSLVWVIARPPWTFPFDHFHSAEHVAFGLGVAIVGTLIPFLLTVHALKFIPSARAGVVGTLEPVIASLLAWPLLDQKLDPPQIAGILVVVAAVAWVQATKVAPTWPTSDP
jgi:drug/metabolite transporter (DMT)-like permease